MKNNQPFYRTNNAVKTAFFILLAFAISGCSPKTEQQEYITFGALFPLTGENADEGLRAFNGLQLAKEEINRNGGIGGKKLDIIVLDDRGDEKFVAEQYRKLKDMGAAAIIGSSYSGVTMALAKASEKDGIPIISPTASYPEITKGRRNVFRAIYIDEYQAEAMAYFAFNSLQARTAIVLVNESCVDYKLTADVFTESFTRRGGKVIASENYSSTEEFTEILKRHSANPPDIIFCPEDYLPAAKLINAVFEAGFQNTHILGSDEWDGLLAYVFNPGAMTNVYYSSTFSFDDKDEKVTQFVKKYYDRYLQMPLSGSAAAYTCVYILAEAIRLTGSTSKDVIISTMKSNELDQITGHIKFDQNNNPRTNVYIIQIKGGVYSSYEKLDL
jgi:branched-chain amino acid transport system substrate-binding protein